MRSSLPDDDFFKTLGIDSLQALDLLTKLENHFRVELPDYELQGVTDFRTLPARFRFAFRMQIAELYYLLSGNIQWKRPPLRRPV